MKTKLAVSLLALAVSGTTMAAIPDGAVTFTAQAEIEVSQAQIQGVLPNPDWQSLIGPGAQSLALGSKVSKRFADQKLAVDVEWLYQEQNWYNEFYVGDQKITTDGGPNQKFTHIFNVGDPLDFGFTSRARDEATARVVTNEDNQPVLQVTSRDQLNFAVLDLGGGRLIMGFEDGLIEERIGPDWDDLVVGISARVVPVPEPGSMALMGLGLIGVGLTRLKRKLA